MDQLEAYFEVQRIDRLNQAKREKIYDQIDMLWVFYDRDKSGALDKEECREFIRDLIKQVKIED